MTFSRISKAVIKTSTDAVKEGSTLTTTVETKNVTPGTTLFWTLTGRSIDDKDLAKGELRGSGRVSRNGSFSFSHLFSEDLTTEGDEKLIISLFADKSLKQPIAETAVALLDSSTSPKITPAYNLKPSTTSVKEGDTFTTTVETKNVTPGTTLFWAINGKNIDANDFSKGSLTGSGIVSKNGSFSFSHALTDDGLKEGNEQLTIGLFTDSSLSNAVAKTAVTIADGSSSTPVATPAYNLKPSTTSVKEGDTFTTTVETKNVTPGTTLFWAINGKNIDANDFSKGSLTGSGIVSKNGSFSFSHALTDDGLKEGNEQLTIGLFTDSSLSNAVAKTAVTIADGSSSTPVATPAYNLKPSTTSVKEGDTFTTTVETKNVTPGTTLFWAINGKNIDANDFSKGSLTGSGIVSKNGSFSFSHALTDDGLKEGNEQLTIGLFTDSSLSNAVAKTAVTIADGSSSTPVATPAYNLKPSTTSVKEGDTFTTTVETKNVTPGTTLFWAINGKNIDANDFSKGSLTGSGIVSKNGSFSFSHALTDDGLKEGNEQLTIGLFTDSSLSNAVAKTAVTIADGSSSTPVATPAYNLKPSTTSVKEGDTFTTTVETKNVTPGTTLFWAINGKNIDANDFSKGSLTGSGIVSKNGSFSFSHALTDDGLKEGNEQLTIGLFTDSSLSNAVAKTAVTIADATSQGVTIKSADKIKEGQTLFSKGKATGLNGQTIFLASEGTNITKSDFSNKSHVVKTSVDANGKFSFKQFINKDLLTEGPETLIIRAFEDSNLTKPLGSSNPITIADTSKQTSYPGNWSTVGKDSVFHRGFNVLIPGPVTIIVDGQNGQSVQASLYGSSNYSKGRIKPIARKTDAAGNIEFTFDVTAAHLKHGNNYRLGIAGGPQNNKGTYEIRLPEQQTLLNKFTKQRVRLGTGDVWRTTTEQSAFYQDLLASKKGLSSVLGTRISCIDTHKFKLYNVQDLSCLGTKTKTGLLTPGDAKTVTDFGFKNYLYPLPAELKINQDILVGNFKNYEFKDENGATQNTLAHPNKKLKLRAITNGPNETEAAQKQIQALGLKSEVLSPNQLLITKPVKSKQLLKLGSIEEIIGIEAAFGVSGLDNGNSRAAHNAENVQTEDWDGNGLIDGNEDDIDNNGNVTSNLGVSGRGITVGIRDSNVKPHPDLSFSRDFAPPDTIIGGNVVSDHGTHVAGTVASSGSNGPSSAGSRYDRGLSPGALIHDNPNGYSDAEIRLLNTGSVDIINESRTFDLNGSYSGASQIRDQLTTGEAGIDGIPYVTSAGNNGSGAQRGAQWNFYSLNKQTKNPLLVANLSSSGVVAAGSALGPFHDNRIGPTISAIGSNINSTAISGTGNFFYNQYTGTSMSAPMVSGAIPLILQAYQDNYLTQYGYQLDDHRPVAALTKAILVNTADDMRGPQRARAELIDASGTAGQTGRATIGPDYFTGFGRLNVATQ